MRQSRTGFESRQQVQADITLMADRLVAEFALVHDADTVRRCVSRARSHLLETGVRQGLVPATEAAARLRLRRTATKRGLLGV